jgi:hypothetical protein
MSGEQRFHHAFDLAFTGHLVPDQMRAREEGGWELVAVTQAAPYFNLFWKRPLSTESDGQDQGVKP